MIAANVAAAKALEAKKAPVMYRIHEPPSREKLVALKEYMATFDMEFALGQVVRPATFNQILKRVTDDSIREVVPFEPMTYREAVERGQVLCKPGSVKPHTKFKAEAYILTKEEGGRHTPFFTNYRPQFYFRTTDVTGTCALPEGTKMVMPGDSVKMTVELITPVALEEQGRFAIREGGKTVGAGVITKIIEL